MRQPQYQPLVVVVAAAAAGIVADRYWPLAAGLWWFAALTALPCWFLAWRRMRLRTAAFILLAAVAAVAAAWHHCHWCLFADDELGLFARPAHRPVCVEAVALSTPRTLLEPESNPLRVMGSGPRVRLDVAVVGLRDGDAWRPASGRARMVVDALLPDLQAGDRFRAFAHLTQVPPALNPGQRDAALHARAYRTFSQLHVRFAEAIEPLAVGGGCDPIRRLEQVRLHGNRIFARYLNPRHAGLAAAVLLGIREQVDPEEVGAFQATGTIHLLIIAGIHLGILAGAAMLVFRRLPISAGAGLLGVAAFTFLYALMVDAQPPVVRAAILVITSCAALYLGRQRLGMNVLALAGLVVLVINPDELFQTGAQLSFLCVAALIALAPLWMYSEQKADPIARLLAESRSWQMNLLWLVGRGLRHLTLVSATIWLLTMPLAMARFHVFNPVAIVLNTAVWIPMTVALVSGFALLVSGTIVPPLAPLCAWLCDKSLSVLQWLVHLGQGVPLGHFWVPGPSDGWLLVFYGGIALAAAFPRLRPPRRWCVALVAGWTAVGFAAGWHGSGEPELRCTFLAVGHGEAIVLELPNGQTLLYDVGQFSAPDSAAQ